MNRRNKKIIKISLTIGASLVGTISLATVVGAVIDRTNFKNSIGEVNNKKEFFNSKNKELAKKYDTLSKKVNSLNISANFKSELDKILQIYNQQASVNSALNDRLQEILNKHGKYHVGFHFGNSSYIRKKLNSDDLNFFYNQIKDAVKKTDHILSLSQVELFKESFDKIEKRADELLRLKNSGNFIIDSVDEKEKSFKNLELAVALYKNEKESEEFKKGELTIGYYEKAIKLEAINKKLWEDKVLEKFNEKVTTNSISKSILNNLKLNELKIISGISSAKFEKAKFILQTYFNADGTLKNLDDVERFKVINDLTSANENIKEFNNELFNVISKYIEELKEKMFNNGILNSSSLLDFGINKPLYDNLFDQFDKFNQGFKNTILWDFEKVNYLITKSIELINNEKSLNEKFVDFVENELKQKINSFNEDLTSLFSIANFEDSWKNVKAFANLPRVDFSSLSPSEYIKKRNELISKFVLIKTSFSDLDEKSVKLFNYGKERIKKFIDAYLTNKNELDSFNSLNVTYSDYSIFEKKSNELLSKELQITSTKTDLIEYLKKMLIFNELISCEINNIRILKEVINSNISDNDKLPTGLKIDHSLLKGFKDLNQLEEIKSTIDIIRKESNLIKNAQVVEWKIGNISDISALYTKLFESISKINKEVKKAEELKAEYIIYVQNANRIINEHEVTLKQQKYLETLRIPMVNDSVIKAIRDNFVNVNSKVDFDKKISNDTKKITSFMNELIYIFDEYVKFENMKPLLVRKYNECLEKNQFDFPLVENLKKIMEKFQEDTEQWLDEIFKELTSPNIDLNKLPNREPCDKAVEMITTFYNYLNTHL
ncbi:hypothetical protein NPA07_01495 [Mycoplasmopsis caviae]|uniref:Uncharacterized protein n=1 Tax=Mycoplasmopsis caviae TaxID=55603 RepID=A0A3P8MDE8_9BACT|nr:hypothetical protein [Mycoplasmopsis caviae]UUD35529.1 hypothetical protein NPA07_01495 [Mycoplasmopsis caviae]VDR41700.1 Uncharacterised protein [Mycoplasmopsis caviae]